MPTTTPDLGTGATIAFATSAWEAQIDMESIQPPEASRAVVQTTKLNATQPSTTQLFGHTFLPGKLGMPGAITLKVHCSNVAAKRPPLTQSAETITITWADGAVWSGSGFAFKWAPGPIEIDGLVTGMLSIQPTGLWTIT